MHSHVISFVSIFIFIKKLQTTVIDYQIANKKKLEAPQKLAGDFDNFA